MARVQAIYNRLRSKSEAYVLESAWGIKTSSNSRPFDMRTDVIDIPFWKLALSRVIKFISLSFAPLSPILPLFPSFPSLSSPSLSLPALSLPSLLLPSFSQPSDPLDVYKRQPLSYPYVSLLPLNCMPWHPSLSKLR